MEALQKSVEVNLEELDMFNLIKNKDEDVLKL
jgi:hypothetical protein